MSVTIRPAAPEDLAGVERVVREAYAPYVARIGREPAPMGEDYAALIADGAVRVAVAGDEVVGVLVTLPQPDHLLLDNVAVAASHRGTGLGRRLVAMAEVEATKLGLPEVRLYTNVRMTENLALYPRLGFRETGRVEEKGFSRVYFQKETKAG